MRKLLLTFVSVVISVAASAQTGIKVEAPNVVAADEQFNVTFIIEGEDSPSDFQWTPGNDFQVLSCKQDPCESDHGGNEAHCV